MGPGQTILSLVYRGVGLPQIVLLLSYERRKSADLGRTAIARLPRDIGTDW